MQPFLGPKYSDWLIGPVARIATEDEVNEYLLLASDAEAKAFIEAFWERQGTRIHGEFGERKTVSEIVEERGEEADRQFSEAGIRGRRTDRGTIYVLHGPPEEVDYEVAPFEGGPPIILWKYPRGAEEGLDGEEPDRLYRFFRDGETTTFYTSQDRRRQQLEQRRRPPRF
ncbi:MAG: GWxTD domain-containing protein [Acidobacteriota bacterium]